MNSAIVGVCQESSSEEGIERLKEIEARAAIVVLYQLIHEHFKQMNQC